MKSTKGTNWTTDYWKTFRNNDASPQQYGLVSGWAMHRENVLLYQFFGSINTGYLDTSEAKRIKTTNLRDYINMFNDLRTIGCSNQSIEKALCSKSVLQFRDDLIALYPNKSQQIKNTIQNIVGNITIVTYNLYRSFPHNTQSDRIPQFASIIKSCNPDLVALQEVRGADNLNQLKNAIQIEGKRFNTMLLYGIGLLWNSRLGTPKITSKSISPSIHSTDTETRAYMIAEFEDFYFISTHYSTDANERNKMSADIITFAKTTTKPVYIAGDLNATPNEQSIIYLTNNNFVLLNDINHKTYSVIAPSKLIDLILGYKKNSTSHSIVSRGIPVFPNEEMKSISDHFPYYVTVNIND
jgi:endonuclease/exonuclease/phosphatase family metal-dependent hydrolase